jgi:hypothetical protein
MLNQFNKEIGVEQGLKFNFETLKGIIDQSIIILWSLTPASCLFCLLAFRKVLAYSSSIYISSTSCDALLDLEEFNVFLSASKIAEIICLHQLLGDWNQLMGWFINVPAKKEDSRHILSMRRGKCGAGTDRLLSGRAMVFSKFCNCAVSIARSTRSAWNWILINTSS